MTDFIGPHESMPIIRARLHGEAGDRMQILADGTILRGEGDGGLSPWVGSGVDDYTADVELVKVLGGFTDTGVAGLRVLHRGPTGTLWAGDRTTGLYKSTDDGDTWTKTYDVSGVDKRVFAALELASGFVLIVADDIGASPRVARVLRSTDNTATSFETASPALTFNAGGAILGQHSWFQKSGGAYAGNVFLIEYGVTQVTGGAYYGRVYRSMDDGATFNVAYDPAFANFSHGHTIKQDPNKANRIWAYWGDFQAGLKHGYSDNAGATWTIVRQGDQSARAVGAVYPPDGEIWATDSQKDNDPTGLGGIYRWTEQTGKVKKVLDLPRPAYNAVQYQDMYAVILPVEGAGSGYTDDSRVRILASKGGNSFVEASFRWPVEPAAGVALPVGITDPDSNGYFWVSFGGLQMPGSDTESAARGWSMKLRLVARRRDDARPREASAAAQVKAAPVVLRSTALRAVNVISPTTLIIVLGTCPADGYLTDFRFTPENTVTMDASNYWALDLRRYRGSDGAQMVGGIYTISGSGKTWTQRKPEGITSRSTSIFAKKGDMIAAVFQNTGSPPALFQPSIEVTLHPMGAV